MEGRKKDKQSEQHSLMLEAFHSLLATRRREKISFLQITRVKGRN